MSKRVYTNGYMDKIYYYQSKVEEARQLGDDSKIQYALDKLNYFISRQKQVYG